MRNQKGNIVIDLLLFLLCLLAVMYVYQQYVQSGKLQQLTNLLQITPTPVPTPAVQALAKEAMMTDRAKQIFYGASPVIDTDRNLFNRHCNAPVSSTTVELGCYTSDNHIYLLNISDPQLHEEMVVTAAHEMLHAAYAQLDTSARNSIDTQLEEEVPLLMDKDLASELQQYQLTEPGQRDNELHSIIGTEYSPLMSSLESYYSQYFTDRSVVVGYSDQFKQVFTSLQAAISQTLQQIRSTRAQMNTYLHEGNVGGYNNLVPQYNALVQQYNNDVNEYNSLSRSLTVGTESPVPTQ